jgi:hypothetical protein
MTVILTKKIITIKITILRPATTPVLNVWFGSIRKKNPVSSAL